MDNEEGSYKDHSFILVSINFTFIAIETAGAYENFLGVDANVIIQEIEFFSEEASKKGIPKFLLKEIKLD